MNAFAVYCSLSILGGRAHQNCSLSSGRLVPRPPNACCCILPPEFLGRKHLLFLIRSIFLEFLCADLVPVTDVNAFLARIGVLLVCGSTLSFVREALMVLNHVLVLFFCRPYLALLQPKVVASAYLLDGRSSWLCVVYEGWFLGRLFRHVCMFPCSAPTMHLGLLVVQFFWNAAMSLTHSECLSYTYLLSRKPKPHHR